jgi:hypothetical protein
MSDDEGIYYLNEEFDEYDLENAGTGAHYEFDVCPNCSNMTQRFFRTLECPECGTAF